MLVAQAQARYITRIIKANIKDASWVSCKHSFMESVVIQPFFCLLRGRKARYADLAVDELRIEPQGPFDARQPSSKHSAQSNRPAFGCKDTQDDTCGLWRPQSENRESFPCVFAELG